MADTIPLELLGNAPVVALIAYLWLSDRKRQDKAEADRRAYDTGRDDQWRKAIDEQASLWRSAIEKIDQEQESRHNAEVEALNTLAKSIGELRSFMQIFVAMSVSRNPELGEHVKGSGLLDRT